MSSTFRGDLTDLINTHSKEAGSNTPDYILAQFLEGCLSAFDQATKERVHWYGVEPHENKTLGGSL